MPGISFEGGNLIVLNAVKVITTRQTFELQFSERLNEALFEQLASRGPCCWSMSFKHLVGIPRAWFQKEHDADLDDGAQRLLSYFRRQSFCFMAAGIAPILAIIVATAIVATNGADVEPKGLISIVIGGVVGGLLSWRGIVQWRLSNVLIHALAEVHDKHGLRQT